MLKESLRVAIASGILAASGTVAAEGIAHPANDESGTVYHTAEYKRADGKMLRVDSLNRTPRDTTFPGLGDTWEDLGGDSGWQLRPHRFDLVNGRLVHADSFPHDTARPKFTPERVQIPNGQ